VLVNDTLVFGLLDKVESWLEVIGLGFEMLVSILDLFAASGSSK